jgi:hypothetical protein
MDLPEEPERAFRRRRHTALRHGAPRDDANRLSSQKLITIVFLMHSVHRYISLDTTHTGIGTLVDHCLCKSERRWRHHSSTGRLVAQLLLFIVVIVDGGASLFSYRLSEFVRFDQRRYLIARRRL